MHQEAPQGGWAGSDAIVLPAAFACCARGLLGTLPDRLIPSHSRYANSITAHGTSRG
jgi:hypothetical protein